MHFLFIRLARQAWEAYLKTWSRKKNWRVVYTQSRDWSPFCSHCLFWWIGWLIGSTGLYDVVFRIRNWWRFNRWVPPSCLDRTKAAGCSKAGNSKMPWDNRFLAGLSVWPTPKLKNVCFKRRGILGEEPASPFPWLHTRINYWKISE